MIRKVSRTWLHSALCVLAFAACKPDDEAATQIIVSVNSDLEIGAEITRVDIEIKAASGSGDSTTRSFTLSNSPSGNRVGFPFSFGIQKGSAERVTVIATGFGPTSGGMTGAVVERKDTVRFSEGKALLLKIFLADTCLGNVCGGTETCQLEGAMRGDCDAIRELDLNPITPGDEDDAWDENDGGTSGEGGSSGEAGASGEGGSSGEAGSSGEGGTAGVPPGGEGGTAGVPPGGEGGTAGVPPDECDPPCATGEQCVDLQCVCDGSYQTYYEDFDGDGYGDPNVTQEGCDNAPSGYVDNPLDCCDGDNRVYPGTMEPYSTRSMCGDGSDGNADWDFDCSGTIEGVTVVAGGTCCDSTNGWSDGWVDTVPFCGQLGTLAVCDEDSTCEFQVGEVAQTCL